MRTPNLTFNLVTFIHPSEQYTFYFTKDETEGLCGNNGTNTQLKIPIMLIYCNNRVLN